jgi:hypothetical protein
MRSFLVKRTSVRSSVIRSAGDDPKTVTLEVDFATRQIYRYRRVPRAKFNGLLKASSKGRYFNANIRDRYEFEHPRSRCPAAVRRTRCNQSPRRVFK